MFSLIFIFFEIAVIFLFVIAITPIREWLKNNKIQKKKTKRKQISLRATDQKAFKLIQIFRTKAYVTKFFYQAMAHNSWHYWIRVFSTDVVTRLISVKPLSS